ncbi:unnamed protein product [Effrenium voratum]|nr:unnamed protein product [Effrenium voratum]
MANEGIEGFAEVVVAPSMAEGANYIIQLTGIGGLVPNTVLMDWPEVKILSHANTADKAVLAVKGLRQMPLTDIKGPRSTIDVWWMIHDGGFLILLSWLLTQHRNWRQSQIRVFTLAEAVTEAPVKLKWNLSGETLEILEPNETGEMAYFVGSTSTSGAKDGPKPDLCWVLLVGVERTSFCGEFQIAEPSAWATGKGQSCWGVLVEDCESFKALVWKTLTCSSFGRDIMHGRV